MMNDKTMLQLIFSHHGKRHLRNGSAIPDQHEGVVNLSRIRSDVQLDTNALGLFLPNLMSLIVEAWTHLSIVAVDLCDEAALGSQRYHCQITTHGLHILNGLECSFVPGGIASTFAVLAFEDQNGDGGVRIRKYKEVGSTTIILFELWHYNPACLVEVVADDGIPDAVAEAFAVRHFLDDTVDWDCIWCWCCHIGQARLF